MTAESERPLTSQELTAVASRLASVNSELEEISKILKSRSGLSSSQIEGISSHISTLSREKAVSSVRSKEISSETGDTSMLVSQGTCILELLNSFGQLLDGQVTLSKIETSQNNLTIDIMIEDTCVKRLGMALITAGAQGPLPLKLRLSWPWWKNSNQPTSEPSQPSSDGMHGQDGPSNKKETSST